MCVHIYHYNIYAHSVCALKTIYCLCFTLLLIISVCTHNKLYLCIHNCASIHLPSSFHSLNSIKLFQAEKNCDCELDNVGMHDNTATNYHKNEKMESPWKSNEQFALCLLICCHISPLYRILLFLKGAIVTLDVNALNWIFLSISSLTLKHHVGSVFTYVKGWRIYVEENSTWIFILI